MRDEARGLDSPLSQHDPFGRSGLWRRALPFVVVAAAAEASLALPPGPVSAVDTFASVLLLVATAAAAWSLPWTRLPGWATVLVPVTYVASVLTLILAAGGTTSGIGVVVLLPLVWSALYHDRWESFVVVASVVTVEVITAVTPQFVGGAVLSRRVLFWSALGLLITIASHDLRRRTVVTLRSLGEQQRRTASLVACAEELSASLSPADVLATSCRLAAELSSPPTTLGRRAQYMRVSDGVVTIVAQYDETGCEVTDTFFAAEHPHMQLVMETGEPLQGVYEPEMTGPRLRKLIEGIGGIKSAIYVPVFVDGRVDGVLTVPKRGEAFAELFDQCVAVGKLTELALSNALAHAAISELATTDPLTGLVNRRVFLQKMNNRPGRRPFAIVAVDLDGLKKVNDTRGHAAGDALIVHVAQKLNRSLRRGDVLARMGGDEFSALLYDADETSGRTAVERMMSVLESSPIDGETPRISAGIAFGFQDSDAELVHEAADEAMYLAKRRGGSRYEVASALLDTSTR